MALLNPDAAHDALTAAFHEERGRVVATLIRVTGDWTLAEDCTQEAFATAAARWPHDGVPDRPGAWLTTTARNAALDRLRRRATEERKLRQVAMDPTGTPGAALDALTALDTNHDVPDDRLRLFFTCCHPALPIDARVALTLRTLGGLDVTEIARAFGVGEAAMAKRLVRAKQKIAHARIPYRVPARDQVPARLTGVLAAIYLVFTEGYTPTAGPDVVRADLCTEAIRLARALGDLLPDEPEVHGLLALMLLHDSRRTARTRADGDPVPLDEQDRGLWDRAQIADGVRALGRARTASGGAGTAGSVGGLPRAGSSDRAGGAGPYVLQAEIAACHATVSAPAATDRDRIVALYDGLVALVPSPHVRLGRAVAIGMARGADAGLDALAELHDAGAPHQLAPHLLAAAEADLLRRAGRGASATEAYRRALGLAPTTAERRFLERRLAELSDAHRLPDA